MNDQELSELLQSLQREKASSGFRTRVLAAAVPAPRRPTFRPFALATALILVFGLALGIVWERREEREREERARVEALRLESLQLARELRELDRLSEPPIVYLGGDDRVTVLYDPRPNRATPASF